MDSKKLEKKLDDYHKKISGNFSMTLNQMINDLDPSIMANEYSRTYSKRVSADPFYSMKFDEMGREFALNKFLPALKKIPESNGSRFYKKLDLHVGIISDEFLYNAFMDVVNLEYISRNNPHIKKYDFVIFATTWKGIDGSWEGAGHPNNEKRKEMESLVDQFNDMDIPTVFYSKEDPVNFHLFKSLAKNCKYIFTTALESVKNYREYTGNDNVEVLQFGINPKIHNPVGSRTKYASQFKDHILFAGSWLSKYPVRMSETKKLFDAILREKAPFTIIDRNLRLENPRYQFPSKYLGNMAPPLPHDDLMKLHKVIRWSINMNSVKYSETMFANRVYELQAFGNILLSNYNTGINNLFPNVRIVNTGEDFKVIYNTSDNDLKDLQAKGIRNVFKEHTSYDRIRQIASRIGLYLEEDNDRVLIVLNNESKENIDNFERQIYENKNYVTLEELDNFDIKEYGYITFFNDEFLYEEYYLEDMLSGFKYTDVDFVTKNTEEEFHNYTGKFVDKYKTMIDARSFNGIDKLRDLTTGYNLDDVEIIDQAMVKEQEVHTEKKLSVIVPIHNNGTYLEEKCFASLKRSSSFDKMEIIFINDGSTDETTLKIISRLRRRHPDIVYIENEAGSGSASKPRNQGVRAATTEYITYLDPDNEATGDGYHYLLNLIQDQGVDMVVGNIVKEDSHRRIGGKYTDILKRNNKGKMFVSDPKDFLIRSDMRVQSIQAVIVRKSVIIDNDLIMVEGAAGQDTMFYQELVLNSKSLLGTNKYIHIYYAAVTGSVTNTISPKFFEKYYKLELERIPYLKKYGLMDTYLEVRFNPYVKQWYLTRLEKVAPEHREEAIRKFLDIIGLYEEYGPEYDSELENALQSLKEEVRY
ncbi:glycosyltransferase [Lacicoccus qingdaonensis]|uniref:Spore maturation protein CgeB n=1 Tax=Lacicoccus qingdaonensis TaxID=576118 RepID=A0A1G9IIR1_9BACL|nr:glycosyltransferase [Salinicoccus qingdaonensis]SDL25060.1 Spore maturation protein CgeB [Salinicoccus qingdaonensis]